MLKIKEKDISSSKTSPPEREARMPLLTRGERYCATDHMSVRTFLVDS